MVISSTLTLRDISMNHLFINFVIEMSLINAMTVEFLFFSWEDLKSKALKSGLIKNHSSVRSPSKSWFLKMSFLLLHNRLVYNKFLEIDTSKNTLKLIKAIIIQNSFFLMLKPFFDEYLFLKTSIGFKYVTNNFQVLF